MRKEEGALVNMLAEPSRTPLPREWPKRIGILNDYVRIPYANGSSFASQFLYREFRKRGHRVTIVGPEEPAVSPADMPEHAVALASLPFRNHPGLHLAMPSRAGLAKLEQAQLDISLAQTGSGMLDAGVWLRARSGVPLVCVNTIHLPSVYNVLLPQVLYRTPADAALRDHVIPWCEEQTVNAYNQGDGLVVLAEGLKGYWERRGVTVPIHVIPRCIEPKVFDLRDTRDPFPHSAKPGFRLLVVCRQTREKGIAELLEIFAQFVAPVAPQATLTIVGDGPDLDTFVDQAEALGVAQRVHFVGEQPLGVIPQYLRHADVFVYTSLSETYGQVVSEAQWCELPVVALADGMGVSQQVTHERTGLLIDPVGDPEQVKWRFAKAVLRLLHEPRERERLRAQALEDVHRRADPALSIERYYAAFSTAREHQRLSAQNQGTTTVRQMQSLARWTGFHLTLAGVGLLRAPANLNRNKARQPAWEAVKLKTA